MHPRYNFNHYRRRYKRFRVDGAANVVIDEKLDKPLVVKDLSVRGAQVVSDRPFTINQKITIIMLTPFFEKPIYRDAKVIWSKEMGEELYQTGLDFGRNNLLKLY